MFVVEAGASWQAQSSALLADAIDFLGDAANYGVSLGAMALGSIWRSRVASAKGWTMVLYGCAVLAIALINLGQGAVPSASTMAAVALLALAVNVAVAFLLYAFRRGDANMRSVWLCSRNDAIGNVAVLGAAAGVLGTGTLWPDVSVAVVLAALALSGGISVIRQAHKELRPTGASAIHREPRASR
jgi:Co/Zn/Cd efflux system component